MTNKAAAAGSMLRIVGRVPPRVFAFEFDFKFRDNDLETTKAPWLLQRALDVKSYQNKSLQLAKLPPLPSETKGYALKK